MFCTTCGKEIHDKAVVCVHCGCSTVEDSAVGDVSTGGSVNTSGGTNTVQKKDLSMAAYVLLGLFFCAHRIYANQKHGVLYLIIGVTALLTMAFLVGVILGLVGFVLALIDIVKAFKERRIADKNGNVKTI